MPRLRRREEHEQESLDLAWLAHEVEGWWGIKDQSKLITKQLNAGKDRLKKIVERFGITDPTSGSIFLDLEEPVSLRKICKLKAQRSVTTGLNPTAAEEILRAKGIWDECVEYVPQLDEGKVHAAYYDKKITDDELSRMFPQSINYSLILLDDNDKPVN
jgi:hypothetical protein